MQLLKRLEQVTMVGTAVKNVETSSRKYSLQSDPTGGVDLHCPREVCLAIDAIMTNRFGADYGRSVLEKAIDDVARAFRGDYPGLLRCDTYYHDLRHSLDAALAFARLVDGHCRAVPSEAPEAIDAPHALLGILLALFHDIGLLRKPEESHLIGAALIPVHERRGVEFANAYLASTPLAHLANEAELIMITRLDYRMPAEWQPRERSLAALLGTADLVSQLSDRCYLEKCRDFLFIEFSAIGLTGPGSPYPDQGELLRKTPEFHATLLRKRIAEDYQHADKYMAAHFDGHCPYTAAIERNLSYLEKVLETDDLSRLRRHPQRVIDAR